jgi:hypothetical protein
LEEKILKNKAVTTDPLFDFFLAADRRDKVKKLEKQFFQNLGTIFANQGSAETD